MIKMIEHQDDVYLNSLIQCYYQNRDRDSAFDQVNYEQIKNLIVRQIESRLISLYIDLSGRNTRQVSLAEKSFQNGFAFERGLFCDQNFTAAAESYIKAARYGMPEANFRLGWLLENELIDDQGFQSYVFYYNLAAEAGSIKALIAMGQRILFGAEKIEDLKKSLAYFAAVDKVSPLDSVMYFEYLKRIIKTTEKINHNVFADNFTATFPTIGMMPCEKSIFFKPGIEADIRTARYCHKHNQRDGTTFLSWCHLMGTYLPLDRAKALSLASQAASSEYPDSLFYLAWIYLTDGNQIGAAKAVHYLRQAAEAGLEAAAADLALLSQQQALKPDKLLEYMKKPHDLLLIEKWFDGDE